MKIYKNAKLNVQKLYIKTKECCTSEKMESFFSLRKKKN